MVSIDETTVMIIGGNLGTDTYSQKTFYYKPTDNSWTAGPEMTGGGRYAHGCGRIREDDQSPRFSIIVAGGQNG